MDLINPVFISIVFFGIITSYTDMRFGKVKNIVIIMMLFAGLFIHMFLTNLPSSISLDLRLDFMQTIINIFLALGFGFGIWLVGFWSEGDAKLFLGYSALLPVFTYKHGYIMFFPSLNILINTFIPTALLFIVFSLLKPDAARLKDITRKTFESKNLSSVVLTTFVLFFLLSTLFDYMKLQLGVLFNLLIIYFIMEVMKRVKFFNLKAMAMVAALVIIFYYNSVFTIQFAQTFLIALSVIISITILLPYCIEHSLVESVNIKNLKEGMVLAEPLEKEVGQANGKSVLSATYNMLKSMKESVLPGTFSRLSDEDVKEIANMQKSGKLDCKTVKVAKTVPFAPFMFFGVLLTYILQGSLFSYLPL